MQQNIVKVNKHTYYYLKYIKNIIYIKIFNLIVIYRSRSLASKIIRFGSFETKDARGILSKMCHVNRRKRKRSKLQILILNMMKYFLIIKKKYLFYILAERKDKRNIKIDFGQQCLRF